MRFVGSTRSLHWVTGLLLALCGCGAEEIDTPLEPSVAWGATCEDPGARVRYDVDGEALWAWPDDAWTVEAPANRTGLRIDVGMGETGWTQGLPGLAEGLFEGLSAVDGFARSGELFLRLDGPVSAESLPADVASSFTDEAVQLWAVGTATQPPQRLGFAARLEDNGTQLVLTPHRPLWPGQRHLMVLTDALRAEGGGCVGTSASWRRLVAGEDTGARAVRASAQLAQDLTAVGAIPGEVVHAVGFTTHDAVREVAAAAEAMRARTDLGWSVPPVCDVLPEDAGERLAGLTRCVGSVRSADLRTDGVVHAAQDGSVAAEPWDLPVDVWLPDAEVFGDGPYPVVLYGHGLNSDRREVEVLIDLILEQGVAVVSADAVEHGAHPSAAGDGGEPALRFLGVDLGTLSLSSRVMRGNIVQSALDRVAFAAALGEGPASTADLDGDGVPELDADRVMVLGVSMGGMVGAVQTAVMPEADAVMLLIAGGRLYHFVTDGDIGSLLLALIAEQLDGPGEVTRVLAVSQSGLDGGDPATFGAHVRQDRVVSGPVPHVVMPVCPWDSVVPPSTGNALAVALDLPHLGPVVDPVEGLVVRDEAGLAGNVDSRTAGYVQIDRERDGDTVVKTNHQSTPVSEEGRVVVASYVRSWADDGVPELVAPYEITGTPELPLAESTD